MAGRRSRETTKAGAGTGDWHTIRFALLVALVCGVVVTMTTVLLRPRQEAYAAIERTRDIVRVAGYVVSTADRDVVGRYLDLEVALFDMQTGEEVTSEDAHAYDPWTEPQGRPRYLPVYIVRREQQLQRVIVPVSGSGMWSTIRALVALEPDLNTIAEVRVHAHGETPGIGDRITATDWLATWKRRRIHDDTGAVCITVSGDRRVPDACRVDGITGATVSSTSLGAIVHAAFATPAAERALQTLSGRVEGR